MEDIRDDFLANAVKYLGNFHVPSRRRGNVCILSSPRSGSTWLMELILTQKGFKPCNEPFNLRKRAVSRRFGSSNWADLYSESQQHKVEGYLKSFLTNRYSAAFKNLRIGQKHYRPITRRIVFKILHGCEHKVSWLAHVLDARVVLLIRHPIPVALSREQLPRLHAFLNSDFTERLTSSQRTIAGHVLDRNDPMELAILDWCLQNVLPLQQANNSLLVLTYEQLVLDPKPALERLVTYLDLDSLDRMIASISRPSGSVSKSSVETASFLESRSEMDRTWLIDKWRKRVSVDQENELMRIVADFGVDVYKAGDSVPANAYWL